MAEKKVRLRLKAGRKFSLTTGEGETRQTVKVEPGTVVEVSETQAKNFADMFEDPNLVPAGEQLTDEEKEALEKFRADKRKEAAEAAAKAAQKPATTVVTEDKPKTTPPADKK